MRFHLPRLARAPFGLVLLLALGLQLGLPAKVLAQPQVVSVTAVSPDSVQVVFDRMVEETTATATNNYLINETDNSANRISVSTASLSDSTVTLELASPLTNFISYSISIQRVEDLSGNPMTIARLDFNWDDGSGVTPIADIQTDLATYKGTSVTIEGQVYIPGNSRGGTASAYIQDDSGRGINLFGSTADDAILNSVGNIVRVTGEVDTFFTTVEIVNLTFIGLLSSGNTPLTPTPLTLAQASDSAWEGTYIEVEGTVASSSSAGGAINYNVTDDNGGSLIVRVDTDLGLPLIGDGNTIRAAGAGAAFQDDFQVLVGRAEDLENLGGGGGGGGNEGITPIADIHDNIDTMEGQTVTVRGQVYIPSDSRGGTPSGYIQDDSGRGINLFGSQAGVAALQNVGNIVEVTGTVDLFFTTVEILDITNVTLISGGNPPLQPLDLTIPQANSSQWEGTYIQVNGTIQSKSTAGGAVNFTLGDDAGNSVIARVDTDLGAPDFAVGTRIWARGAGSAFQSDFQVTVGLASAITDTEPADQRPPDLLSAFLNTPTEVSLRFNEAVDPISGAVAANYRFATATDTVEVISATVEGAGVRLVLASPIDLDSGWMVLVLGVADANGNAISRQQSLAVTPPPSTVAALDGPARTLLPREGESYPVTMSIPAAVFEGGFNGEILLRIFDLQGRLISTIYDSRSEADVAGDFQNANSSHTVEWPGTDELRRYVPAGSYIAHLAVVDSRSGNRNTVQMPVVVATRLER